MERLIPGKTKVQIELFKGVRLADILVGLVAFVALVFVLISSLPYKFYIIIGVLLISGALLMRMDTVPNYIYLLNILRHFAFRRFYGRKISDKRLLDPEAEEELSWKPENSDQPRETEKQRKKRRKEEDRLLASRDVPEEEKEALRQRRKEEYRASAARMALYKEATAKREPMQNIIAFTGIRDGYIEYDKAYYGAVLEIPPVEFRFFSQHRRNYTIEGGLGKLLRSIHSSHGVNIVKLERPIRYEEYLQKETAKLEQLRQSFEKGMLTEAELQARVEIMYDRISDVEHLCDDAKVIEPFYYIVIFDSDKRQLENQIKDAQVTLSNAQMQPKRLDDKQLALFLKYSNYLDFDENEIDRLDPADYATWAMPQYVNIRMRTVEINRILTHNMRVVDYPRTVSDAWLAGVLSMPGTKCVIKCHPMDREKAVRSIDRSLQELRGQYANTGVDSKRMELQTHIETLGSLLATLQQDNEALLQVNIYVTAYDYVLSQNDPNVIKTEKSFLPSIPDMKRTVRRAWQESGIRLNNMEFTQTEAFIGSQISAWDPMHKEGRGIPSNSLAAGYPWIYASVSDLGGIRLGRSDGVPVFIDFFRRDSERVNSNMVIVGKSGSGKSYATKTLLANLAAEDSKIFILDPENEYTELAQNLHGKFINVGNAQHGRLNPFQIITALEDDEATGGNSGTYATHLQFLEEFFRQILPDCDKDALEYLNSLVDRVYTNKGITPETDISTLRPEDYPVFDDLYDAILAEFQQTDNNYIRSILRVLMNYIAKFSAGGRNANIWNGHSSVTTEENFIVFNFQSLLANRNNTIANAQMLLVLKHIDNEIIKNRDYNTKYGLKRKIVVVIDEAHVFIDTKFPVALDFMFQMAKRIRKYNGMQIVITQNIKDFVGSEEIARKSTAIINACQYSFMFALAPNDMDDLCKLYEKAGGINENEQEQITNAPRGQAFAVMSPVSRSTFHVEAPDSVVQMFRNPGYVSQYFTGEAGNQNWEDFVGQSRLRKLENLLAEPEEDLLAQAAPVRKKVTFTEIDEAEFEAEQQALQAPAVTFTQVSEPAAPEEQPLPAEEPEKPSAPAVPLQPQVIQTVVQAAPVDDATTQALAKLLNEFSYEAMRSEIRRSVEELVAQNTDKKPEEAVPQVAMKIEPKPVAVRQTGNGPDYSEYILPDGKDQANQTDRKDESIDIMALLSAQAKKMEKISAIEMMEVYGEITLEISLEELEKYINKRGNS